MRMSLMLNLAQNQAEKARYYFLQSLQIRENQDDGNSDEYKSALAESYNCIGIYFQKLCEYEKAKNYYLKSIDKYIDLAIKNSDKYDCYLANVYGNIGTIYVKEMGDKYLTYWHNKSNGIKSNYEENARNFAAEKYFEAALEIHEKMHANNPLEINASLLNTYCNIALLHKYELEYDEAEKTYLKALDLCESYKKINPAQIANYQAAVYNGLGALYYELNQTDKSEMYRLKAISVLEYMTDLNLEKFNDDLANSYESMRYFYIELGEDCKAEKFKQKRDSVPRSYIITDNETEKCVATEDIKTTADEGFESPMFNILSPQDTLELFNIRSTDEFAERFELIPPTSPKSGKTE